MKTLILSLAIVASLLFAALRYSQDRTGPIVVSGFVEADEVRIGSRVGGRVHRVLTSEGATVQAGEVLVLLEPFNASEQRAKAAAELDVARAELDRLRAGLRPDEIAQAKARRDRLDAHRNALVEGPRPPEIEKAQADVRLAEAEVTYRAREHERALQLTESLIESEGRLDLAVFNLRAAEATLASRKATLDLLLLGTRAEELKEAEAALAETDAAWQLAKEGYRAEDIAQAEARVRAADAALATVDRSIDELSIRAPITGVIEALDIQPGDLVAPNAPVLSLIDTRHLWVRTYVPEDRLDLATGQVLPVAVDAWPDERFQGEVSFIARDAEFTPGNIQTPEDRTKQVFRVKVTLKDGMERLRAGMAADVYLPERD